LSEQGKSRRREEKEKIRFPGNRGSLEKTKKEGLFYRAQTPGGGGTENQNRRGELRVWGAPKRKDKSPVPLFTRGGKKVRGVFDREGGGERS